MLGRRRFFMDVTNGRKMGRPPKYPSSEESKKARNRQHNAYRRANYDHLQANVPLGMNQRVKEAAQKEGMSKDAYVTSALEERLEKTEKISS